METTTTTTNRPVRPSAGLAAIVKAVSEGWVPLTDKVWPKPNN